MLFMEDELAALAQPIAPRSLRCAVYARVSVEDGQDKQMSSIEVQTQACRAFIEARRHENWLALDAVYADNGYSGGNLQLASDNYLEKRRPHPDDQPVRSTALPGPLLRGTVPPALAHRGGLQTPQTPPEPGACQRIVPAGRSPGCRRQDRLRQLAGLDRTDRTDRPYRTQAAAAPASTGWCDRQKARLLSCAICSP